MSERTRTTRCSRRWIKSSPPTIELQQRLEASREAARDAGRRNQGPRVRSAHRFADRVCRIAAPSTIELKRRLSEWERKRTPCTLILLDIDFFKKFNDTHGHQVGDEVLRTVAKTLRAQARDMDLPCRYGGEEFAVILPATDAAGACIVAERIRKAVEASVTTCEGKTLKVTCSIGVSQVVPSDDSSESIRRADDALYASKKAGRNCGHWSDGTNSFSRSPPPKHFHQRAGNRGTQSTCVRARGAKYAVAPNFIHSTALKRRVTESHRFGIPLSRHAS